MDVIIAFLLFAAPAGETALAGGPDAPLVSAARPCEVHLVTGADHRVERSRHRATPARHQNSAFADAHRNTPRHPRHAECPVAAPDRTNRSARPADRVQLSAGFFAASSAGGVERPAPVLIHGRRGVIVIAPHRPAPVSAGQAAAARGLPRG